MKMHETLISDRPREALRLPILNVGSFLTSVGARHSSIKYKSKDIISRQGDPATSVYYIESGHVQINVVSREGKEGVIGMLGPGEFFGECCLTDQLFYMASGVATGPTTAIKIKKAVMLRLLNEEPSFSEAFMTFLLSRNIQFEADLVDQLLYSSEKRLARVLLLMSNSGTDGKARAVMPKVSQGILAARVGTTRSRVNFFVNKFRDLGMVERGDELMVHPSLRDIFARD